MTFPVLTIPHFRYHCPLVLWLSLDSTKDPIRSAREAGDIWCLPPVWNLRAVIWFHFAISSYVFLPSPVTLSVLSFFACWPFLLNFFWKILQYFSLREMLFCMSPALQLGEDNWSVVCVACCHMTLVFAVTHLYNIYTFFLLLLAIPFLYFLKSGIDKSMEWSTIPACPSLMCFF